MGLYAEPKFDIGDIDIKYMSPEHLYSSLSLSTVMAPAQYNYKYSYD